MRKIDIIGNIISGTIIGIFFIVVVSLTLKRCDKKSDIKPINAWENKQIVQDSSRYKMEGPGYSSDRPIIIKSGTVTDQGYKIDYYGEDIFETINKFEKEMKRLRRIEAEHNSENCCVDGLFIGKNPYKEVVKLDSLIIKIDTLK